MCTTRKYDHFTHSPANPAPHIVIRDGGTFSNGVNGPGAPSLEDALKACLDCGNAGTSEAELRGICIGAAGFGESVAGRD